MIETYKNKKIKEFYEAGKLKNFPSSIVKRALIKLTKLNAAQKLEDLKDPKSNRLHELKDDLAGFYSISIDMQYRIIFKFKNGNAYEVDILDYH